MNYLLVEKLFSMKQEESWAEIAEYVDNSSTFKSESFRCKAIRKYAAYHKKNLDQVTLEEVVQSPQGLQAWGEMQVVVPGMTADVATPQATTSEPGAASPQKGKGRSGKRNHGGEGEPRSKKTKTKKERSALQEAEQNAKQLLSNLQWSQQIVDRTSQLADQFPSQYAWCKAFLLDYSNLCKDFKDNLTPAGGEDLREFLDSMKLAVLNKSGLRSMKKEHGDQYEARLVLLVDRTQSIAASKLACN